MSSMVYPLARKDETIISDFHGTQVADPYRWLEDPDSDETKAYVSKLNDVSRPFLESCPVRNQIKEKLTKLWDFPKYSCPSHHGDYYFYSYNSGLQNQSVLYIQKDLKDPGKIFLDPNVLSDDGTTALTGKSFTEDGTIMAYALSEKGSDWTTVKFKKVPSGEDLPDVLTKVKFSSLEWTLDKGFFYNAYPRTSLTEGTSAEKHEFHSVYYHRLGTSQAEDVVCVQFKDNPEYMAQVECSEDGKYLFVGASRGCDPTNTLQYYDMGSKGCDIKGQLDLVSIVDRLDIARYDFICNDGPTAVILTNENAPMFKLITVDLNNPQKENWKTLIPEKERSKLQWACCVNKDMLVVAYLEDVKSVLHVYHSKTGKFLFDIPLEIGSVSGFFGKQKYSEIFFKFTSQTTPGIIYRCDLAQPSPKPEILREITLNGVDLSKLKVDQEFYTSKDGTKVPMFIVHRKDWKKDGSAPARLYGYGGYNVPILPSFSLSELVFVNHFGGICATANIRGGSEYGEKWHEGAVKERKQNCFDDFIAAAEFLVKNRYTSSKKLFIEGASNGGLLVAAVANQRPELIGAVVNSVGVLDMLRYHLFTIGQAWVPEVGCPDEREPFQYIFKYSPLHNLKCPLNEHGQYPAMLLLTADHDDRVVPSHSLKYMATLYAKIHGCQHQKNPLLIRVETKAGHGAGKPTSKLIDEATDVFCFLQKVFGLQWED